ncbi:MAG: uracil-DNA glycosylase [Burkholderiaceae bacterium]
MAPGWRDTVEAFAASAAGERLLAHLQARQRAGATIFPADPLRALALTDRPNVRVVILGQDPYHGAGQAEGLAFSVPDGCAAPPSLRNVFAELLRAPGVQRQHTSLRGWAEQGVLLLNTVLSVEEGQPGSHARLGWEALTDSIIGTLADTDRPLVFMLWGAQAAAKQALFSPTARARHAVLLANHPSPLSARRPPLPFIGCGHFAQADAFLAAALPDRDAIDWSR